MNYADVADLPSEIHLLGQENGQSPLAWDRPHAAPPLYCHQVGALFQQLRLQRRGSPRGATREHCAFPFRPRVECRRASCSRRARRPGRAHPPHPGSGASQQRAKARPALCPARFVTRSDGSVPPRAGRLPRLRDSRVRAGRDDCGGGGRAGRTSWRPPRRGRRRRTTAPVPLPAACRSRAQPGSGRGARWLRRSRRAASARTPGGRAARPRSAPRPRCAACSRAAPPPRRPCSSASAAGR